MRMLKNIDFGQSAAKHLYRKIGEGSETTVSLSYYNMAMIRQRRTH